MRFISRHGLLMALGAGAHAHVHTHMHTDDPHMINFKKPGTCQPYAGTCLVYKVKLPFCMYGIVNILDFRRWTYASIHTILIIAMYSTYI